MSRTDYDILIVEGDTDERGYDIGNPFDSLRTELVTWTARGWKPIGGIATCGHSVALVMAKEATE